ncbi:MAG: deoxyribodipyrimidine photo-lyase [Bacteroidales bacterium]|jgi:deoxyribodipyrimidine photo-lyase
MKTNVIWLRRDLRIEDNTALQSAMREGLPVLPLFIFDTTILNALLRDDARVTFIYSTLLSMHLKLKQKKSGLLIKVGNPEKIWSELLLEYDIDSVFINRDYEPYALHRDELIRKLLIKNGVNLQSFKDQVIFEPNEILKNDGNPYTVFTPYKKRWLDVFSISPFGETAKDENTNAAFYEHQIDFPSITQVGFIESPIKPPEINLSNIFKYDQYRDIPELSATTLVGPHLRFGTISIRNLIQMASSENLTYLSELIWREFFMQILYHFPKVVDCNFKSAYDQISWRNNQEEFFCWCTGNTGYPMVDAGMRQLNETGYLHNRVRMVAAGFLCKHLLIDWRWGEAYFATHLLDYELSSNNGNWQWAAGTGCDAVPYFRVFNPLIQAEKFDPKQNYASRWIPELNSSTYAKPIVDHAFARQRAIDTYRQGLIKPHF